MQLSVVIPVRNAGKHLDACLNSVLGQTLREFELLLLDDASADDSFALAQAWAARDSRIQVLRVQGRGIVAALNQGLAIAKADYVARMDADDIMRPARLQKQLDYFQRHPSVQVLACQVQGFPAASLKAGYLHYLEWQNQVLSHDDICLEMYVESPMAHPSVMFHRESVVQAGGYRQGSFPEDYELWLRLMSKGAQFHKLGEVLLDWRESPERTSRVDPRYAKPAFDRLRANFLARDARLLQGRPLAFWGAGRRTRQGLGQLLEQLLQKDIRPQAWIDIDPRKIGNKIAGIEVRAPDYLELRAKQDKPLVLVCVNNHGAKALIAKELHSYGYRRGQDYIMVG